MRLVFELCMEFQNSKDQSVSRRDSKVHQFLSLENNSKRTNSSKLRF